ncbi:MAG: hypothetical protein ACJ8F1_16005 [Polyangia bacterium]
MSLLTFAFTLATSIAARAAEVNLTTLDDDDAPNYVHLRTGAEYGFVAGVGYDHAVTVGSRRLLLTSDLTFPWASIDRSDYRFRVGAVLPVALTYHWRLAAALSPTIRHTVNDAATMTGLGADASATGGYYAHHWFAAAELGFDWNGITHVNNSQLYRDTVYDGARDGWYGDYGGNIRTGGQVGASFSRYDVVLRAGVLRDASGEVPLLPFYGTLTVAARW